MKVYVVWNPATQELLGVHTTLMGAWIEVAYFLLEEYEDPEGNFEKNIQNGVYSNLDELKNAIYKEYPSYNKDFEVMIDERELED